LLEVDLQLCEPRLVLRLDNLPSERAQGIVRHGIRIDLDPLGQQKWVLTDAAETVVMLR